ncbi:MAG: M28 family peptidase [Myxococcota bacterium]
MRDTSSARLRRRTKTLSAWALACASACASTPSGVGPPAPPASPRRNPQHEDLQQEDLQHEDLAPDRLAAALASWVQAPRTLGDPRRAASIERMDAALRAAGAETIEHHRFSGRDPGTDTEYALTNIYAHFRPGAARRFVLATHFDTRPWADEDPDPSAHTRPVPGANDGTSGLVVVLALAPVLAARLDADVGFSVALFDGEELGRPDAGGYCAGSRALAQSLGSAAPDAAGRGFVGAEFGIVLDMVADADLRVATEPTSVEAAPDLVRAIWATAEARGQTAFDPAVRAVPIVDDHTFLTEAGIPSVLVIDYEYDAWHTVRDTLARTSGESLAIVADVVLAALLEESAAR